MAPYAVGNFGSVQRIDYTIIGNHVNLASQLETAAEPGIILIAHETWLLVRDAFDFTPQAPIHVKGFERPTQTYVVGGKPGNGNAGTAGERRSKKQLRRCQSRRAPPGPEKKSGLFFSWRRGIPLYHLQK